MLTLRALASAMMFLTIVDVEPDSVREPLSQLVSCSHRTQILKSKTNFCSDKLRSIGVLCKLPDDVFVCQTQTTRDLIERSKRYSSSN